MIKQFTITKSGGGEDSYAAADTPDIDITGQSGFEPSHYLIRAGGSNADEVVISFDGVTDAITIATPTNNGCIHVRVKSRARKVWVRRSGNANATAVALISPSTDI